MSVQDDNDGWKSETFRRSIARKIAVAIQASGVQIQKTSNQIENEVFVQAKSQDEYIDTIARLIYHLKEMPHQPHPLLK